MKPTLLLALLWPALPALAIPLAPGVLSPGLYGSYGPGGDCQARPLVSLGANLRAVAAASPYWRCGPPVQPAG